ncbi:MAG: hypothetical protein WCL44_10405 [bacterium]
MRDREFWALAAGIFAATYPGLSLIGNLKPIGLWFGVPEVVATGAIMVLAAGNGLGRVAWGVVYDKLGGRTVGVCMAAVALSVVGLAFGGCSTALFLSAAMFFGLAYGGSLAIFPARVSHVFTPKVLGSVYPVVLVAHGLAGITGAPLQGWAYDMTGSHYAGFGIALAVTLAGWAVYARLSRAPG